MSHFCLLSDPESYVAHDYDIASDEAACRYWLDLFANHFELTLKHAVEHYGRPAEKHVTAARRQFNEQIDLLRKNPKTLPGGNLNVIELCRLREGCLHEHKLHDPFGRIKDRENESATRFYGQVVRKLHAMETRQKWLHLVECVFAGNIFDLGSVSTFHLAENPTDFLAAVENTKPRPWLIDDYDALEADLLPAPPSKWTKVVVFVDNAGSDFILGIMPLVRELALSGTKIVLAANELPSLNDITADEAVSVLPRLAAADGELADLFRVGMFEVVSTGSDIPLIDLAEVSDELNEAAADADLVILEGMGRAVESNLDAAFTVDSLKLALLKDPVVASHVGGELYDCICKYTPVDSNR
ncbi:MAG: DUF89 family protein [Phycisphaerae bacterium]|nr:DUF89 family protein [Phycisphaerae bacterium]